MSKEMLASYISRRHDDVKKLNESLAQNSVQEFKRIGHQILGSAGNYGFSALEPLAREMESLSQADLRFKGPRLISDLSAWAEKTNREL